MMVSSQHNDRTMDLADLWRGLQLYSRTTLITALAFLGAWLVYQLLRSDPEPAVSFTVPAPEQCKPGWQGKTLDNPSIKVSGSTAIQCYTPATARLLGLVNPVTPDGIDRAISKASKAQLAWARTTFAQRRVVLKSLLAFILDNQEDIVRAACLDSGKTRVDALFGEVLVTVEKLRWTLNHGEKALQADRRPTNLLMFYKKNEVRYEPLGVVAACVSWNYPFHNLLGPIISALFTGNAIAVKNSEQTAWSSTYFASIVRSCLSACGHSPDLVQVMSCWPGSAAHLTSHPGISQLTFIGSRPVALEVAKSAAKSLTPLCVELGGKDAAIVLDDPRGKVVAEKPRIASLRQGDDLTSDDGTVDVGAMVSGASFSRLESLIDDAVAQGARLLVGGHAYQHPQHPQGHYFTPTLLVDVTPDMRIAHEELFAPICVLMRASSIDSALVITNSTPYGLGCSVFGPSNSSAARENLQYIANHVRTGMVAINDFAAYYAVQLPFGGVSGSGYGRFAGEEGLRSLCNVKSVCVDRWPWLIKTTIPGRLDYPMQAFSWPTGRGIVEIGYADSWRRRLTGVKRIAGL
ncbi:Meiotic Sister-Chromatid recombination aldehyde dehydrogenase [Elasticomyces elasticus]|nr:Meiotic Sister-Chromatid recombination aldehyde dehydrogenase [Elasticomyces elasticus]